jgi:hypothetical protein
VQATPQAFSCNTAFNPGKLRVWRRRLEHVEEWWWWWCRGCSGGEGVGCESAWEKAETA